MKDTSKLTLRHIAALYLDIYSTPRDLARPLTPEQVKDAGVLLFDLLSAHEAEMLIEQERAVRLADKEPTLAELSRMFIARYRRENDIDGALTEDDWLKASEVFLSYVSTI